MTTADNQYLEADSGFGVVVVLTEVLSGCVQQVPQAVGRKAGDVYGVGFVDVDKDLTLDRHRSLEYDGTDLTEIGRKNTSQHTYLLRCLCSVVD